MIYEIAEKAQKNAQNICDNYEIYVEETRLIELDSKKDELNFAKEEIEKGIGIRVLKDNKLGFAFTSNLNKIEETVTQAVKNTKLNEADKCYSFCEIEKVNDVKKVYDKKIDDFDLNESVEFLENVISKARDSKCDVTGAGFSASSGETLILNSNGVSIENKGTSFGVGLSVNLEKDSEIATAYNSESSRFFDIDGDKLAIDVCDLAKNSIDTKSIETGDYNVVLDYYAASGLLQTFMGAFDGENVRRERSILKGKIGEEIVSPNLSIINDPTLEKGMYTSKCDDEGTVSRKTALVDRGILNSFMYDIYTGNKEGIESTSNGYRGSYLTTPMISPSNLVFKFSEMREMSEIDNGVLTTSVLGAHTANPISGDFSVEANNAFKIENGELTDPIDKAMISGNIFEIMKKCEGIKSQIKQKGPFIIPKLLVHDLRVVGQN